MILPVSYTDQFKTIYGELLSDGSSMTLIMEGYHFVGRCLDDFRPRNPASLPTGRFKLNQWNCLDDCTLSFELPLQLIKLGAEVSTGIRVTLKLDAPNDRIERTVVAVELLLTNKRLGNFNCFEGVMDGIIQALPSEYKIKCCYGCAYSDYNYAGQQFFGDMFCFRDSKREYLQARSKEQFSELMERSNTVQETHLCPDFKDRLPNTGYRG